MSRQSQQLVNLVLRLVRNRNGKFSWKMIALLCVGALLYSLVLQPVLEKSLGISLPSITANAPQENSNSYPSSDRSGSANNSSNRSANQNERPTFDPSELTEVLEEVGRGAYRTPAGLRYTRGSEHGHRIAHVLAHSVDEPNQPGQHGVFDESDPASLLLLIDEAYEQALSGKSTKSKKEEDRIVYNVDLNRRIGYVGGTSGKRRDYPSANGMRLVIEGDRLITAFPVRL